MQTRLIATAAALSLLATACDGGSPATDLGAGGGILTVLDGPDVGIRPGEEQDLRVQYADAARRPIQGAQVRFAIFGDPHGSTLASDAAVTDAEGTARVRLHAGAVVSRFQIRASAPGAKDATFYVEVSAAGFGALTVIGQYQGTLPADLASQLTKVVYRLYGNIGCSSVDPFNPPPGLRTRDAAKVAAEVNFESLPLDVSHTIAVEARRPFTGNPDGQLRAAGCVELPVGALKPCATAGCQEIGHQTVTLLLSDLQPRLSGAFALTSQLKLPKTNRPLEQALGPWADLVDCPLDPVQLVLDCILDAVDDGDPLDCVAEKPSAAVLALLEERGSLSGPCRGATTDRGTSSLEKLLRNLGGTTLDNRVTALSTVEVVAAEQLRKLGLASTLTLGAPGVGGAIVGSHSLDALTFSASPGATFQVPGVGLAKWLADPVSCTVAPSSSSPWDWQLAVTPHSFSLRYGLLAREALGQIVITPAGLPPTSSGLVADLVDTIQQGSAQGCEAIDALACKAARLKPGCLNKACPLGLAALAQRLDAEFLALDGAGTDFTLEGIVELRDNDGDLRVDSVGSSSSPGSWKMRLTLGGEVVVPQQATFFGKPQ